MQIPFIGIDTSDVGGIVAGAENLLGLGKDSTGLPQKPVNDAAYVEALVNKWYNLYAGHPPSQDDHDWWKRNISQDGPQRAFINFCKALKDSQGKDGMALSAMYAGQYGDYTDARPYGAGSVVANSTPITGVSAADVTAELNTALKSAGVVQPPAVQVSANAAAAAAVAQSQKTSQYVLYAGVAIAALLLLAIVAKR